MNIGTGTEPLYGFPFVILLRHGTPQKPAVIAFLRFKAVFYFIGFGCSEGMFPSYLGSLLVIGVKQFVPYFRAKAFLHSIACIFCPSFVEIIMVPIRICNPKQLWHHITKEPEFFFRLLLF